MKFSRIFAFFCACVAVSFVTARYLGPQALSSGSVRESAYERVMRTKTLRCGYADWPPFVLVKDPTTNKISGLASDVIDAMAAKLSLKVEWVENVGWASVVESVKSHRIDMFCAGAYRDAEKGRWLSFTAPIFYSAVYAYVRADDHRFDKDLSIANDPAFSLSGMDGDVSSDLAKQYFPKAKEVSVPQMGELANILVNVATRKADLVFEEPSFVDAYIKANPGKLRRVQDKPFQTFQVSFAMDIHETGLRDMFDNALAELHNIGAIEEIISRYSKDPAIFLRVAKPYEKP